MDSAIPPLEDQPRSSGEADEESALSLTRRKTEPLLASFRALAYALRERDGAGARAARAPSVLRADGARYRAAEVRCCRRALSIAPARTGCCGDRDSVRHHGMWELRRSRGSDLWRYALRCMRDGVVMRAGGVRIAPWTGGDGDNPMRSGAAPCVDGATPWVGGAIPCFGDATPCAGGAIPCMGGTSAAALAELARAGFRAAPLAAAAHESPRGASARRFAASRAASPGRGFADRAAFRARCHARRRCQRSSARRLLPPGPYRAQTRAAQGSGRHSDLVRRRGPRYADCLRGRVDRQRCQGPRVVYRQDRLRHRSAACHDLGRDHCHRMRMAAMRVSYVREISRCALGEWSRWWTFLTCVRLMFRTYAGLLR